MDVLTYYKAHLYDYAYNVGYEHEKNNFGLACVERDFDFWIISDFLKLYEPTGKDWRIIEDFGFKRREFNECGKN